MRRRGERGALSLRALYSISELASVAGVHRHVMRRLVLGSGVRFVSTGRKLLVPLSEIQDRLPDLWQSLLRLERARYDVGMVQARAGVAP